MAPSGKDTNVSSYLFRNEGALDPFRDVESSAESAEKYVFTVMDPSTTRKWYCISDSQVLLDWILEPVAENDYREDGYIEIPTPEGVFSSRNALFFHKPGYAFGLTERKNTIVLGGADPLRAKAMAAIALMRLSASEAFDDSVPQHRRFTLTRKEIGPRTSTDDNPK